MKPIIETDQQFICEIQADCFQLLSPEEGERIRAGKTQVLFRKGDMLTKQAAFSSYILFLLKGICKVYLEGADNRSFNINLTGPGEFLGLDTLYNTQATFAFSTMALSECQAFLIDKQTFEEILQQNVRFANHLFIRYCTQSEQLTALLKQQLFHQMPGKLAQTLLYLEDFREREPSIFQLLTRKDLGDFIGSSTEGTIKLLKSFEREGLIELDDKDIRIRAFDRLQDIRQHG